MDIGYYTRYLDRDIPAGVVVFLVAFPSVSVSRSPQALPHFRG